jgi:hypothetical protein
MGWTVVGRVAILGDHICQPEPQHGSSSHQAGLYCAQLCSQDLRNFIVGHAFKIAQDNDGAERLGQLTEFGFYAGADFLVDSGFKGRLVLICEGVF